MKLSHLIGLCISSLFVVVPAQADTIDYNFSGNLVDAFPLPGIHSGDLFNGTFSYDSAPSPISFVTFPNPFFAVYPAQEIALSMDGITLSVPHPLLEMTIDSFESDLYIYGAVGDSLQPGLFVTIGFRSGIFPSPLGTTPPGNLSLSDWTYKEVSLNDRPGISFLPIGGNLVNVDGRISSLTRVEVREPPGTLLFVSCLLLLTLVKRGHRIGVRLG